MKVLVATSETQGRRRSDFCHVQEGVLVHFPSECDGEDVDGRCGCRRSVAAFAGGATTTFKVAEMNITREDMLKTYREFYEDAWRGIVTEEDIQEVVAEHLDFAAAFPVGAVLEKRGSKIRLRAMSHA